MTAPHNRGRVGNGKEQCGSSILAFPGLPYKNCTVCGVPFTPCHPWHRLCRQCWTFRRIAHACCSFNRRVAP